MSHSNLPINTDARPIGLALIQSQIIMGGTDVGGFAFFRFVVSSSYVANWYLSIKSAKIIKQSVTSFPVLSTAHLLTHKNACFTPPRLEGRTRTQSVLSLSLHRLAHGSRHRPHPPPIVTNLYRDQQRNSTLSHLLQL